MDANFLPAVEAGREPRLPGESFAVLERMRAAIESPTHRDEPRHSRLRTALLNALAAGAWSPGDKLPSETEIAKSVGLSLGTVQKVLTRLAGEAVLVRRHGHGTFVSGASVQVDRFLHFRFVADDGSALVPVYAEALDRTVVRGGGPWSDFLGAASCIRIRRRINVADEFDCLSEYYIDAEKFAAVLEMPFRELHRVIIRELLAKYFNAPAFSFMQRVYATDFPAHVRSLLKLSKARGHGMVLEINSYTHHRAPISFQNIFIPAGVRRLEIPSPHPR